MVLNIPTKRIKLTDQEYHIRKIRSLMNAGKFLLNIPEFPKKDAFFYDRPDESGWWMPLKQSIIASYVKMYLLILQQQEFINTCFIDPLSSYGMNKLTKNNGKDTFIFPGTSLNAALISSYNVKGFSEFFINDIRPEIRAVIRKRFEVLNQIKNNQINFYIEPENKGKIDSNKWLHDIIKKINEKYRCSNYLMIIDNQGMDIGINTIRKIQEAHEFGDIIITFHDSAFSRIMHNQKKNKFFYGTEVVPPKIDQRRDLYIKQLKTIGLGRIEQVSIRSEGNFFYTLLFCCRKNASAKWLNIIKHFRTTRYRKCTDQFMKYIYDIAEKKIKPLSDFI